MGKIKQGREIGRGMCVCVCTQVREKMSLYVFVCMEGVGCNLKYDDRKGFTEKVTFKQVQEEVAVQAEEKQV